MSWSIEEKQHLAIRGSPGYNVGEARYRSTASNSCIIKEQHDHSTGQEKAVFYVQNNTPHKSLTYLILFASALDFGTGAVYAFSEAS